jgi:hypothetical protein
MQENETPEGTIIIRATEETMDMYVSEGFTKADVMQILIEALHGIEEVNVDMDEKIPQGALSGVNILQ